MRVHMDVNEFVDSVTVSYATQEPSFYEWKGGENMSRRKGQGEEMRQVEL
jgi:hypothetical protein